MGEHQPAGLRFQGRAAVAQLDELPGLPRPQQHTGPRPQVHLIAAHQVDVLAVLSSEHPLVVDLAGEEGQSFVVNRSPPQGSQLKRREVSGGDQLALDASTVIGGGGGQPAGILPSESHETSILQAIALTGGHREQHPFAELALRSVGHLVVALGGVEAGDLSLEHERRHRVEVHPPIGVEHAAGKLDRGDVSLPRGAQTQHHPQAARGQTSLIGMRHQGGVEESSRLQGVFVRQVVAEQEPLLAAEGMLGLQRCEHIPPALLGQAFQTLCVARRGGGFHHQAGQKRSQQHPARIRFQLEGKTLQREGLRGGDIGSAHGAGGTSSLVSSFMSARAIRKERVDSAP